MKNILELIADAFGMLLIITMAAVLYFGEEILGLL